MLIRYKRSLHDYVEVVLGLLFVKYDKHSPKYGHSLGGDSIRGTFYVRGSHFTDCLTNE